MVSEYFFVVQIEVVVPDDAIAPQGVVKGGVQVEVLSAQFHDVPGVPVADAFFRVVFGDDHDAPQTECVTEGFHRLGNPLTDTDALPQRSQDLVGVGLFQLVIAHVLADKIVDVQLLLPLAFRLYRAGQLGDPGGHGPLVLPDLSLVEEVLGEKVHAGSRRVDPAGEACDVEDLRVVQAELE